MKLPENAVSGPQRSCGPDTAFSGPIPRFRWKTRLPYRKRNETPSLTVNDRMKCNAGDAACCPPAYLFAGRREVGMRHHTGHAAFLALLLITGLDFGNPAA